MKFLSETHSVNLICIMEDRENFEISTPWLRARCSASELSVHTFTKIEELLK